MCQGWLATPRSLRLRALGVGAKVEGHQTYAMISLTLLQPWVDTCRVWVRSYVQESHDAWSVIFHAGPRPSRDTSSTRKCALRGAFLSQ